ncbi:ATP-binding cassette domain-containing protein [Streptomyces sp. 4F14]|uniref:ATP-binding cassette domain-containing protein n=1 Tax=Streptomyces sp. 4F14 TaxID=3394380 RepID=UPI003A838673
MRRENSGRDAGAADGRGLPGQGRRAGEGRDTLPRTDATAGTHRTADDSGPLEPGPPTTLAPTASRAAPTPPPSPTPLLPRALRYLLSHRAVLLRLSLWSLLEAGQSFLLGYALAKALDEGFLVGRAGTGTGWLAVGAAGVLAGAVGTGKVYGAVADLVEPLRDRLVAGVVRRGVRDADRGALSGVTQQVEIARDTSAGLVLVSRSFVFTSVGALVGLFSLAPVLLAVVLPPLAAGVALFVLTLRPLARRQEAYLRADEALAAHLGTVCPGLRDITAAGAERNVEEGTARLVDAEFRAARALARWSVTRILALAVGGQLPIVLLLLTAPWLLGHDVTPGALVGAFAYVTQSLLPALNALVHGLGASGSRLTVVLRRLTANTPPPPDSPHAPPAPAPIPAPPNRTARAALTLTDLTFAYGPASTPVLDGLTLTLPPGAHLTVVGPSGIGKSTLTALIAATLTPTGGEVRIGGRAAPDARARRVLIPQEAYVFTGTLAENLTYLRADAVPEAELWSGAEAVGMAGLMRRLGGPDALLDPAALSTGERQLIALTRAYLSPAPLALLDEATSHLDPVAEERAERAFARRPGGTLVVVAHRIASARRADRILVMDGADTAYGTHPQLLETSPLYRDLVGRWAAPEAPEGPGAPS